MPTLKIEIKDCRSCPKYDHSGAFTPGGAIPLCLGVGGKGQKIRGENRWPSAYCSILPNNCRHYTGEIPEWCPLGAYEP